MIIHKKTDGEMFREILKSFRSDLEQKIDPFFIAALKESAFKQQANELKYLEYCYDHSDINKIADDKYRT
jgi:hypothetical protein